MSNEKSNSNSNNESNGTTVEERLRKCVATLEDDDRKMRKRLAGIRRFCDLALADRALATDGFLLTVIERIYTLCGGQLPTGESAETDDTDDPAKIGEGEW